MDKVTGYVTGVNGNLVAASFSGSVRKNEVGYVLVGDDRMKGEVIRVNGDTASMQIYEMTNGIQVGDKVELSGELMSVELGPGLLTQVFDGLQNPLPELAEKCGFFLERGVYLDPIPNKDWEFTPLVKPGDTVTAGDAIGSVPEGLFTHLIMVPFGLKNEWKVKSVREKGVYNVRDTVAVLENEQGEEKELTMVFSWPVKQPIRCYEERLRPDETLVTQLRCVDTFLPVAKGGTFCVPGPFGAGKTVLQHMEAKNADVDVVIVAACGERAGEVVEVLTEFPELTDPRTGRSLMERTIIICNTSSMPVAAREASVYTAVTMAEYYRQMGLDVLLLAPTGRAAQRMSQLCGRDAQTVHRALGMSWNELTGEVTFRKNEKEPLEADAVIVDEMSMVDLELMASLLRAMRPGCRLVMVGDPDQLPSVGAGNVLGDLLRSGVIPSVSLTEIFRQAEKSAIIRNAHAVNTGRPPELKNTQNDFFFLCRRAPDRLVQTVVELCRQRLPNNMGIPAEQIQVLSPTRKGVCGTVNLNRALQAALNPPAAGKRQKLWGDMVFREGDRVMQTRNNYDVVWEKDDGAMGAGIFNGDVGVIQEIDPSGELITIQFDDRTCVYTADLLNQLDMAYAMTVHKAQGSEYRCVVLVSAAVAPALMVRGVLYTAITRARELLVLVGDDVAPGQMAANDRQQRRYSGLRRRLREEAANHGME